MLYDVIKSTNPKYPYWNYEKFTLQDKSEAECKTDFRFEKYEILIPIKNKNIRYIFSQAAETE